MIVRNRLLAATGIIAFILALLTLVPARFAPRLVGFSPTVISGLSGTLWHGAAQRIAYEGFTVGPVRWTLKPSRLLLGQLAADVEGTVPDGFVNGAVAVSVTGKMTARALEAAMPLALLAPDAGVKGSQLTARFDELALNNGWIETAVGTLQVAGLMLASPSGGAPLGPGAYLITFDAAGLGAEEPLTGAIKDTGGPLEIAGTIKLSPPTTYELSGIAKPRGDAPDELRNALQMLGPPTPDGGHSVSFAGTF